MGNFLLPWKEFTSAATAAPRGFWCILAEPETGSACPFSENFGNRWVANPCMWVTPLPAWIDRGLAESENAVQVATRAAWKLAPAENDTETRGLR